MMKSLNKILIFLFLSILPSLTLADDLYRGFGFDALTIDRQERLDELIALVTEKNVNSFRVQYFNSDVDSNYENDSDKGVQKYLDWVDNTVLPHYAWLKASFDTYNVTTMISLHNPVGGRELSSPPVDRLFEDDSLKQAQIQAWGKIATVYNGDTSVIYQIFSEPATTGKRWREFYSDLITSIS